MREAPADDLVAIVVFGLPPGINVQGVTDYVETARIADFVAVLCSIPAVRETYFTRYVFECPLRLLLSVYDEPSAPSRARIHAPAQSFVSPRLAVSCSGAL